MQTLKQRYPWLWITLRLRDGYGPVELNLFGPFVALTVVFIGVTSMAGWMLEGLMVWLTIAAGMMTWMEGGDGKRQT